ncbi:NYN domain-containing protein [Patescibacteria group bacterium]|nr:NYN domain-containing protein [Patescibacteria group bacterium]MBU1629967.1 NYN domain-containing protein [Patescibacteria group bacterium]MBU1908147.1 NYN domain-containing protein [Patescibacteria group bacterium]
MIKHLAQRVAVLVDAQNMYHSAKHLKNARLNFGKAVEDAVGGRPLVRAVAYVAKSKTGEESSFFDALVEAKIEPKIKDVQEYASGAKKADWDVGMAIDAVMLAEKVDVIILMTGDGDFVPLVEYLHGRGVMVEVAAFSESTNSQLREVADNFIDLSATNKYLLHSGIQKTGKDEDGKSSARKGSTKGAKRVRVTF